MIVFIGDGAANSSPMNLPTGHWTNNPTNQQRPCGTAVQSAQRVKDQGTVVYTIGYDLNGAGTDYERCLRPDANGHQQASTPANYEACGSWGCNAYDAIRAMATSPSALLQQAHSRPAERHLPGDRDRSLRIARPAHRQHLPEPHRPLRRDANPCKETQPQCGTSERSPDDEARERTGARRARARSCRSSSCCCSASCSSGAVFRDYIALTDATRVGARQARSRARSADGTS